MKQTLNCDSTKLNYVEYGVLLTRLARYKRERLASNESEGEPCSYRMLSIYCNLGGVTINQGELLLYCIEHYKINIMFRVFPYVCESIL